MPGDKDRDDTRTLKEMQRDIMNGMTAKESMEGMGIHPANQKSLLAKYMEFSKDFSEGPIETGFEDEEGERPYDINDPSTHYLVKAVGGQHGQIRGSVIFQGSLKDIVAKFGDAVDDPNDPDNWFEGELGIGEDAVVVSADPSDDFSSVEAYRAARGIAMPEDDEDEPRRGISGYEHKPDALVSARQAGAKHKPYVSSFVSDGGKIFGVMGSDGKIVHKTRDKQKAYKWFRDNYDNI
jgi:hypothetical protein